MQPAQCPVVGRWFTYRHPVGQEPKRIGSQCPKIGQWFCNKAGSPQNGIYKNVRVNNVYCKNADGYVVYCEEQYGTPHCGGVSATCTKFKPNCQRNSRRLVCDDTTGDGQTAAEFSDGAGGHTYVDSTGRNNCAYKFGILYRDFVDTCYATHRDISSANLNGLSAAQREAQSTQVWPCLPWIPSVSNGGALGFSEYFNPASGSKVAWIDFRDPDLDLKEGVYTSASDPAYLEALRGQKWPNALRKVAGGVLTNEIGLAPSYLGMNMAPWIDPVDGATGLHQNNVSFAFFRTRNIIPPRVEF